MQRLRSVPFIWQLCGSSNPTSMRCKLLPAIAAPVLLFFACASPVPEPAKAIADAEAATDPAQQVERGRYLIEVLGCGDCHSPKLMGPQGPYPDPERLLSGFPAAEQLPPLPKEHQGWVLFNMDQTVGVGPWGTTYAANLTSDESGIGNWSEEQFIRAVTKGLYKGLEGSRPLLPPMPWQTFRNLKAEDLKAMFAYLKSTKPVTNVVPAPVPPVQP